MTAPELEAQSIWVNKSSKTGYQVMGCGGHFHGERMELYVPLSVFLPYTHAAIAAKNAQILDLIEALRGRTDGEICGCGVDNPTDVCLSHYDVIEAVVRNRVRELESVFSHLYGQAVWLRGDQAYRDFARAFIKRMSALRIKCVSRQELAKIEEKQND